jgi:predicted amidohydrolase
MVLPGYMLMSQGTQVHIAAWPGMSTSRHMFLSRAFASQAGAYVIDVGAVLSPDHVSDTYKDLASSYPGESCIIDPTGEVIAGPVEGETILVADCSTETIFAAKSYCDVAGHYSRPDVFQLRVNRNSHRRVVETEEQEYDAIEAETESATTNDE